MKGRRDARACGLAAALIAAAGAAACSRGSGRGEAAGAAPGSLLERQFEYLNVAPLRRFFAEKTGPDGAPVFEAVRLGTEVASTFPKRFPKKKGPKVRRIFLVGGSVVQLFDEAELDRLLRRALPGYSFEILDCGISAYDSARDELTVREIADYEPDLVVLMSGVNEGEQGGTPDLRGLPRVLKGLAQGILLGRPAAALRFAKDNLRGDPRADEMSPGFRRAVRRALRSVQRALAGEPTPRQLAEDFEGNMGRILGFARARGIPLVVCALPWNMRDTPPRGTLPLRDRSFFDAWRLFETRRYEDAAAAFRAALQRLGPGGEGESHTARGVRVFAEYFLARSLDRMGLAAGARSHYLASLEDQVPPMPRLNRIVRRLSGAYGVPLADLERVFAEARPQGLVGSEFFEDDMHWARVCDPLVAATIVRTVVEADLWRGRSILAPGTVWDTAALAQAWEKAAAVPVAASKEKAWTVFAFRVWDQHLSPDGRLSERVVALMEEVYRQHPALMLNAAGMKEWIRERVAKNIWNPNAAQDVDSWWPAMLAHVGEMLLRQGRPREAAGFFAAALDEKPGLEYLKLRRAIAAAADGRRSEALQALAVLEPLAERFPEIRFYKEILSGSEPAPAPAREGGVAAAASAGAVRSLIAEAEKVLARPEEPGKPAWWRVDPEAEGRAGRILDRAARGDGPGALAQYHREVDGSSATVRKGLQEYCGAERRRCAPLQRLMERLAALNDEGIRLFTAGDDAGAGTRFDEALRLDPRDLNSLLNRAAVSARREDFAGARALYDRALDLQDLAPAQKADALSSRAGVLERLALTVEAAADLAAALQAAPQDWPRRADAEAELRRLQAPKE